MKQRTLKQNNSIHLFCQQIASELIAHGISLNVALKDMDIKPEMETIKSVVRQIAGAKYGYTSTTELQTHQVNEVFEDLVKALEQNTGIPFIFPNSESTPEAMEALENSRY